MRYEILSNFFSSGARLSLAVIALVFALSISTQAQIYMKIGDIKGESTAQGHENWVEVRSLDLGQPSSMADSMKTAPAASSTPPAKSATMASSRSTATNAQTVTPAQQPAQSKAASSSVSPETAVQHSIVSPRDPQSGLPTGQRMHKPIVITKQVDKASPLLMQAAAKGVHFNEVVIEVYRSGAFVQRFRLKDAMVSSVQRSAARAGNDRPTETVSLAAAEISEEK